MHRRAVYRLCELSEMYAMSSPSSTQSFDDDEPTCRTCLRKCSNGKFDRSAFRGLARENHIPTDNNNCDLDVYLNNNLERIEEHINDGINEHT